MIEELLPCPFCGNSRQNSRLTNGLGRTICDATRGGCGANSNNWNTRTSPASATGTPSLKQQAEPADAQERGDLRKLAEETAKEIRVDISVETMDGEEKGVFKIVYPNLFDIIYAALLKASGSV